MSRATGAATLARSALSSFTAWVTERWSSSKVSIGARVGTKVASLIRCTWMQCLYGKPYAIERVIWGLV